MTKEQALALIKDRFCPYMKGPCYWTDFASDPMESGMIDFYPIARERAWPWESGFLEDGVVNNGGG